MKLEVYFADHLLSFLCPVCLTISCGLFWGLRLDKLYCKRNKWFITLFSNQYQDITWQEKNMPCLRSELQHWHVSLLTQLIFFFWRILWMVNSFLIKPFLFCGFLVGLFGWLFFENLSCFLSICIFSCFSDWSLLRL